MEASLGRELSQTFIILLTTGLLYVAARTRPKVDQVTGVCVLEYPVIAKAFGWLFFLSTGGLLYFVWANGRSLAPFWVVALFGAFFGGSVCCLLEWSLTRGTWNDYEVTLRSPWAGERRIPWTDIKSVTYSDMNRWFVVKSRTGVTIRLHEMLGGLPHWLQQMQARLPFEVYATCEERVEHHLDRVASATDAR